MPTLSFPDIAPSHSGEAPRAWLPKAEAIVDACEKLAEAGEPEGLADLLEGMGAPVLDMVVTPLSARAALRAAAEGRAFYHHELRKRVPMPEAQEPELPVWQGGTVPEWREGVLEEPKYFSFFQDTPFPAFNPNHRRKWRPHELIHGALTFFWHPEMTRFEMYVGSRLNELLPVVHWYGFDEVFRPRCPKHRGEVLYQTYCAECEAAARPYWETDESWRKERREAAMRFAERGLEHFDKEWRACMEELDTGRIVEVDWPHLDASSDAIGYMRGHWNRVTAWSFGVWVETFLQDGLDYFSSLERYADHQAGLARELLSGDLSASRQDFEVRRGRRAIQDAAYRIYLALDWLEVGSDALGQAESVLMPRLEQAAHHVHHVDEQEQLTDFSEDVVGDLLETFDEVRDLFPSQIARVVPSLGYTFSRRREFIAAGIDQVEEGLEDACPVAFEAYGDKLRTLLDDFAASDHFERHGRLANRFSDWLEATERGASARELVRLEAWAMQPPKRDRDAELFGSLPGSLEEFAARPATARSNETLRREQFAPRAVARVFDDPSFGTTDEESVELARIFMRGELRMILVDARAGAILDALSDETPRHEWTMQVDADTLASLLENGFVVWLPKPS